MKSNTNVQHGNAVAFPHIGRILEKVFSTLTQNRSDLARRLGISSSMMSRMADKDSIQLRMLWDISMALNHNFIAEVGEKMPVPYTTAREKELHEQLAMQQKEIEKLKIELAVYREILSK